MKKITITIDGPASSGKGTTAKGLAEKLGYKYLDSGALYRGISLYFERLSIEAGNFETIKEQLPSIKLSFNENGDLLLGNENVAEEIRTMLINKRVSTGEARNQDVRDFVTQVARDMASEKGYVLDGRDAATHLAPQAELKIYLDCDVRVRAQRRALEYGNDGDEKVQEMIELLNTRDEADKYVLEASKNASNATVNTSEMTIDEQIEEVYNLAQEKIEE